MAYKQPSSRSSFKMMGSSPAKHGTTDDFLYGRSGHNPDIMEGKHEDWHTDKIEKEKLAKEKEEKTGVKKKPSPNKQYKGSGHGPATKFDKKRYPVGNPELTDKNPYNGKKKEIKKPKVSSPEVNLNEK